jgi:tRNA(adenine34) deaminase
MDSPLSVDERYMQEALKEALKAYEAGEVPVGAVITCKGKLIARAHNQMVTLKDPTAHAEMIAITQAAATLKNERLTGTVLYTTMEPCAMCAGALVLARIQRVIYGAADLKAGACGSVVDVVRAKPLNHRIQVQAGIYAEESARLLKGFFQKKRGKPSSYDRYMFDLGADN